MIGRLRGVVAETAEEDALIDVAGVGYVVRCGARTLGRLPALGEEVVLHVESQWSEAAGPRLYGFLTREERRAFVMLQGAIQGVGAKVALAKCSTSCPRRSWPARWPAVTRLRWRAPTVSDLSWPSAS